MDSILKEFSTLVPRDFSYLLPYNNLQDGEGYSAIDVSRGGYVQEPSASPLSSPAQSPNPECVLTDIDNSEGENQVPGSNTAISSDYPALKTPGSCTFESTKGSGLEKETTPSHVTKVQTEVVIPGPSSSKPKSTEKMCKEYRATIQIYRKALSIYHQKLTKASALWRSRAMTWYPVVEGTQQFHNPMEIDCMLPTEDPEFLAELGNNPSNGFIVHPPPAGVKRDAAGTIKTSGVSEPHQPAAQKNSGASFEPEPKKFKEGPVLPNLPAFQPEQASSNPDSDMKFDTFGFLGTVANHETDAQLMNLKGEGVAELPNLTSIELILANIGKESVE